ncbi:type IV pilus biogenesis protein PilM [Senegalia massiliensis]|uniref:type IV pilus biogenesis protein PilM n=1 Tax=Senegalia massiliensis TaxID=1720316 RepID=UPI001031CB00|nr:pilus assembly protein PilM [Senegalia massiliensis]
MFDKKILSLDIGNKNIKILQSKITNKSFILENAITIKTPKNSINDGNIMNANYLSSYIKENLDKEKMKGKYGIITLDYSNIISREIILPFVKKDDIEEMVKYEIEEFLPITLNDYVLDYRKREEFIDNYNIKKIKLLVVAIPKKTVKGYMELLEELDLNPMALDLNSNAISKLINKEIKINGTTLNKNTVSFLDIGYKNTNINLISNGVNIFNRVMTTGTNDLPDNTISEYLEGIERLFTYYKNLNRSNKIEKIYLYGGGSKLKDIDKHIESYFNIPTEKLKEIDPLKVSKSMKSINIVDYFNNIGSTIRL